MYTKKVTKIKLRNIPQKMYRYSAFKFYINVYEFTFELRNKLKRIYRILPH